MAKNLVLAAVLMLLATCAPGLLGKTTNVELVSQGEDASSGWNLAAATQAPASTTPEAISTLATQIALPTETPVSTPAPVAGRVSAASGLNVREGPGLTYRVISTLVDGATVAVLGRDPSGEWIYLRSDETGPTGWSYASYLVLDQAPESLVVLDDGIETAGSAPPPAAGSRNDASRTVVLDAQERGFGEQAPYPYIHYVNYRVEGATPEEMERSIERNAPYVDGRIALGVTSSAYNVSWETATLEGVCTVAQVAASLYVTVTLPHWDPPASAHPSLVPDWDTFAQRIREHELTHVRIDAEGIQLVEEAVQGSSCTSVEAAYHHAQAEIAHRHDQFHREEVHTAADEWPPWTHWDQVSAVHAGRFLRVFGRVTEWEEGGEYTFRLQFGALPGGLMATDRQYVYTLAPGECVLVEGMVERQDSGLLLQIEKLYDLPAATCGQAEAIPR